MDAAAINRMLELRVRDLAGANPPGTVAERKLALLRALGLDPLPPRTELNAEITGVIEREGYRIEKLRYESRPGLLVTAHLYVPEGEGKWPVVLRPHGHWPHKKTEPLVQASGISFALAGFACLIVDSPGYSWDDNELNERRGMGPHEDWFLAMGAPIQGVYAWDLMRGLDYLETRTDLDATKVGITGESGGGTATMFTFAIDERIRAAAPVCAMASYEIAPHNGCLCNHVPGAINLGDRSDVLGLRAPAALFVMAAAEDIDEFPLDAVKRLDEKLRRLYKSQRIEWRYRFEVFEGGHDYNRRMREAAVAFFGEHLRGDKPRGYVSESRPITDGALNPYPAQTVASETPALMVTHPEARQTVTFRDLLVRSLEEPYPQPFNGTARLAPWLKYGRVTDVKPGAILAIHDPSVGEPKEPGSILLPADQIDQRLTHYLGLSVPELFAQLLHLNLPGGPDGWETASIGAADALTSMIASVRTLVHSQTPEQGATMVTAAGPVASMTALFLRALRPSLAIETTHPFHGWDDALEFNLRQLVQPGARYLQWVA